MQTVFALTLFLSAALLFAVQPLVAKRVLPQFGGTPAVWNTCMVFFQAVLLAGYGYVHLLGRASARRQTLIHLVVLLVGLTALTSWSAIERARPLLFSSALPPAVGLLGVLAVSVGLPFFAISATAPLLQGWFARTAHPGARDPYFLYSASNLGSMIALLSYPVLLEPYLGLKLQGTMWMTGYGLLVAMILFCSSFLRGTPKATDPLEIHAGEIPEDTTSAEEKASSILAPRIGRRLRWLALAFVPSSMLYGVTTYLTTDVAPVPFLWVAPLAVYLLTFILVFARRPPVRHAKIVQVLPLAVLWQSFVFAIPGVKPIVLLFLMHLLTFFVVSMACHGELARDRPSPLYLTAFYLWLSFGGVLGGIFNALVAPVLFESLVEYPLSLVLVCFLVPAVAPGERRPPFDRHDLSIPLIFYMMLTIYEPAVRARVDFLQLKVTLMFGLPAAAAYLFHNRPFRFGLMVGGILLSSRLFSDGLQGEELFHERSFFGVVRVVEAKDESDPAVVYRRFFHGSTLHGTQRVGSGEPLSYYFRNGPIGQVFDAHPSPKKIVVLGLGTGSLTAYGKQGQEWTFFEIDPLVDRAASNYFTFLSDCATRGATVKVEIGDARLKLEAAADARFDMIFADAFSSDAVPVHLLTREALRLYLDRLAEDGLVIFNITNRYLDLEPVLAALAEQEGLVGRIGEELDESIDEEDKKNGKTPSRWVILARKESALGKLVGDAGWRELRKNEWIGPWTDDYSNLFLVFRWR